MSWQGFIEQKPQKGKGGSKVQLKLFRGGDQCVTYRLSMCM